MLYFSASERELERQQDRYPILCCHRYSEANVCTRLREGHWLRVIRRWKLQSVTFHAPTDAAGDGKALKEKDAFSKVFDGMWNRRVLSFVACESDATDFLRAFSSARDVGIDSV